jgi:tRNA threonylcarbamoyladenosine biosynthesis protein TsaB
VLAIETATIEVGVAIADETGPLATVASRPGRLQAETLHPAIAEACRVAGLGLGEVDAIAVDVGPGLFTGLRVGIAAAKALAAALGVKIVTATSLEVLASASPPGSGIVVPVIDMRRGEVAWLALSTPGSDVRVGAPAELAEDLAGSQPRADAQGVAPILLVGDGALRYREFLARALSPEPVFGGSEMAAPPVVSLAVLAVAAMKSGRCCDPAEVRPLYGREADARINWTSRHDRGAVS